MPRTYEAGYWHLKYDAAIRELQHFNVRNSELMAQNDELSDRIHLDLDPRIKQLTAERDELREDLEKDDKIFDVQRKAHAAQLDKNRGEYIKRLAELVTEKGELRAQLSSLMNIESRLEWNRDKLKKIDMLARSAL